MKFAPPIYATVIRSGRAAGVMAALWVMACAATGGHAADHKPTQADASAALIAELRKSFTLHGKPIPPEIFRDMGDGDMADSGSIWVTVDVAAAIGSNLYYDPIQQDHGWISQKKVRERIDTEETGYMYVGSTANGLLVVVAAYSGGGTGDFFTLHILDVAAARAFDLEGKSYQRINLTIVRSVILGDRWQGEARIFKNAITITKPGPGVGEDSGERPPITIVAVRP